MTFDEIQAVLENMLSVQRGLQESQLKLQESQLKQQEKLETLLELTKVHEQRFTQFYGYHQAAAGDQVTSGRRVNQAANESGEVRGAILKNSTASVVPIRHQAVAKEANFELV